MITAGTKALLSTQGTLASIHEVAKEFPACGGLIAAQALGLCHTAMQHRLIHTLQRALTGPCAADTAATRTCIEALQSMGTVTVHA